MKATEQYFLVVLFIMLYNVDLYIVSLWMECLGGNYSNESYWAVISYGTDY